MTTNSRVILVLLALCSEARLGLAETIASIDALRKLAPPTSEVSSVTVTVGVFACAGDGGGGRFAWDPKCDGEDDNGSVIRPSGAKLPGAWVRIRTATFVDAREYGCRPDHERLRGDLTADGSLVARTTAGERRPFSQSDVGKIVIIRSARSWPDYSDEPVPLNARIAAVNAAGAATVKNLDGPERGTLLDSRDTELECFTDNTDAIALALEFQSTTGLTHVQLPDGVVGICPFASQAWDQRPTLDTSLNTKAAFVLHDKTLLKGSGRARTLLKLSYFGEFEPFKREGVVPFHRTCILFLLEPLENRRTTCGIESLAVEFPHCPAVQSGYTLVADGWNTSPARNAIHATFRDLAVINPTRNATIVNSIHGGIYDAANRVVDETVFHFEDCTFETGGGFSIKNQNNLGPDQKGGKEVHLKNVQVHGGGNVVTRHFCDAGSFEREGDAYYLTVDSPGFTWKDFNAHSNQVTGAFNPICMLRKSYSGIISSVRAEAKGTHSIEIQSPAGPSPVTKAGATMLIAFGGGNKQIYLKEAAAIQQGSNVASCRLQSAQLTPEEAINLVGQPIRIYYEQNELTSLYQFSSPRRIRLDSQTAAGQSLLGQSGLDVTVNFTESQGAFGHSFYVGDNVSFFLNDVTIHDCAKRSFRVSSGGSQAMQGHHELNNYLVLPSRGMAAMANRRTVHQAMEEFGGRLKLRRSQATSVYGVELDMDDQSTFESQGGVLEGSLIRNSKLRGWVTGGPSSKTTLIENSDVDITLVRLSGRGDRDNLDETDVRTPVVALTGCTGSLAIQNGNVTVNSSHLRFGYGGSAKDFEMWNGGIAGTFDRCTFAEHAFGLHELTANQRREFLGQFKFERCDGDLLPRP